jgi:hypothetical protein
MASGNDQTIHEIFADNDSENEGFDPEDIYIDLNNENGRTDLFDSEKWGVGSITGSVLQYSLMSDCEIIPIARISAM